MGKVQKTNSIIHGVQVVVLVGTAKNIINQKILLVQDRDDRGRGDGIRMYGVPGGGIESSDKIPRRAIKRELFEEVALKITLRSLQKVGCYKKLRPTGFKNNNHLFTTRLSYMPDCMTNDPKEVSKVHVLEFKEILDLANQGMVHEGSIRLLFHFLNGTKSGLLNEPVTWNGHTF